MNEDEGRDVPQEPDFESSADVFGEELWDDTREVVDEAHRLLGNEMVGGRGKPKRARVTLEVPEGLLLIARYVTAREVFRQDMGWTMDALKSKGAEGKAFRRQTQMFLEKCLSDALHDELHALATGSHRLLRAAAEMRGWRRSEPEQK